MPPNRRESTTVHIAIDHNDPVYDCPAAHLRLHELFASLPVIIEKVLPPALQGKLCWIWARLASSAFQSGSDFFILLGDDVLLHSSSWQSEVEEHFAMISSERQLPFGVACVAVQDRTFPVFPTFPVMHRMHLEIFEGALFPPDFINQHGDPYLFELYRRWGAARFTHTAALSNCIGGASDARYAKASQLIWRDLPLSNGIEQLERWLATRNLHAQRVACLDVVVPSYRCDINLLSTIASLDSKMPAALSTLIVVDRPDTPNLETLKHVLTSYRPNRLVRIFVMALNEGASVARNTGLAQSFGDHVVLLDDDVVPESGLLDAYLGAIMRHPDAAGYVGLTHLPPPTTMWQHAMHACHISYFYTIANETSTPPWGVTANLCVRARSNNNVWFNTCFPKTGGGEDVDFCLRLCRTTNSSLVSVPGARVMHPYWARPLAQVIGWATGDVLCLTTQAQSTFVAPPNWAVIGACSLLLKRPDLAILATGTEIALNAVLYCSHVFPGAPIATPLLAAVPPMLQDVVRLVSKLRRLRFEQVLRHFDWMDGQENHVTASQLALLLKGAAFAAVAVGTSTSVSLQARAVAALAVTGIASTLYRGLGLQLPAPLSASSLDLDPTSRVMPFVVLASQRTGSNLLCGYLHHHPMIAMHNELFNEKKIYSHHGSVGAEATDLQERDSDPGVFLRTALGVRRDGAVGFKAFPEHMRRHEALFDKVLADRRVRKIVLRRENRLAVAVSMVRASVTGDYQGTNLDDIPVAISPEDHQRFITSYDAYYEFLCSRLRGQHVIELTYEELTTSPTTTIDMVLNYLNLDPFPSPIQSLFTRQTFRSLKDAVVNFGELQAAFIGTPREVDFGEVSI